ncbi:MAG: PhoX family phosphatase [Leptothrix sp. (in: b-proteobacteria)]
MNKPLDKTTSHIDPDAALQASVGRRSLLRGAFGATATALFSGIGLSACGGGGGNDAASITAVEFIGMAAPTSDADRAGTTTRASVKVSYSDGTSKTQALAYNKLYSTGDTLANGAASVIAGGYFDAAGSPSMDSSVTPSTQFFSDCPDGQSLLKLASPTVSGVTGNTVFLVSQFEYLTANGGAGSTRPTPLANDMYGKLGSQIAVTTLSQDKTTGALSVVKYSPVNTSSVHGLWITCAGSLSPWNTHLSSEEYEPDAVNIATNTMFQAFSQNVLGSPTAAKPYHYGHVPEVTVNPDGTGSIKKHYCLGRIARELVQVMPDQKTVLMGDDGSNTGLFMFIADTAADLSAGTLYVAKWATTSTLAGGGATLTWIKLGHATSAEIEALANTLNAADIVTSVTVDPLDASYSKIAYNGKTEWVKFNAAQTKAAAFLETHRYAAAMGASMEFTKMEGVTLNAKDKLAYIAISYLYKSMSDAVGDIQLPIINAGATFQLTLSTGQKDTASAAIGSDWVPTVMAAVPALVGEDLATPDTVGNTANVDKIANPDNLKFSEKLRTLFIGEDSGMHVNNFLWAYNVDTKKLSRILSVPAGAESTGLQAVDNLNGFAYLMSNFQHAGDWTGIHAGVKTALDPLINAQWNGKKSAAVGYLSGMPVL